MNTLAILMGLWDHLQRLEDTLESGPGAPSFDTATFYSILIAAVVALLGFWRASINRKKFGLKERTESASCEAIFNILREFEGLDLPSASQFKAEQINLEKLKEGFEKRGDKAQSESQLNKLCEAQSKVKAIHESELKKWEDFISLLKSRQYTLVALLDSFPKGGGFYRRFKKKFEGLTVEQHKNTSATLGLELQKTFPNLDEKKERVLGQDQKTEQSVSESAPKNFRLDKDIRNQTTTIKDQKTEQSVSAPAQEKFRSDKDDRDQNETIEDQKTEQSVSDSAPKNFRLDKDIRNQTTTIEGKQNQTTTIEGKQNQTSAIDDSKQKIKTGESPDINQLVIDKSLKSLVKAIEDNVDFSKKSAEHCKMILIMLATVLGKLLSVDEKTGLESVLVKFNLKKYLGDCEKGKELNKVQRIFLHIYFRLSSLRLRNSLDEDEIFRSYDFFDQLTLSGEFLSREAISDWDERCDTMKKGERNLGVIIMIHWLQFATEGIKLEILTSLQAEVNRNNETEASNAIRWMVTKANMKQLNAIAKPKSSKSPVAKMKNTRIGRVMFLTFKVNHLAAIDAVEAKLVKPKGTESTTPTESSKELALKLINSLEK